MFDNVPVEDLRKALNEFQRGQQIAAEALHLPPGTQRSALTDAQAETLGEYWVAHIYSRPPHTWTGPEKAAILAATNRALRTLASGEQTRWPPEK